MKRLLRVVVKLVLAAALVRVVVTTRWPRRDEPAGAEFQLPLVFDGIEFASTAAALRHGRVIAVFGGADVDLREAPLDPGGAVVQVVSIFGGARVIVSDQWTVAASGRAVLGGTEIQVSEPGPDAEGPVLSISTTSVFGGVLVTADPDEDRVVAVKRPE